MATFHIVIVVSKELEIKNTHQLKIIRRTMFLETNNIEFQSFIHTIQIGSIYEYLPADEAYRKPYIVRKPRYSSGRVHYVINPNKLFGESVLISTLSDCIEAIRIIIDELMLGDSEWRLERVDYATHTYYDYDSLFKINCYLKHLFALQINCRNSYRVIDDQMENRSTVVKSYGYELEIYNKHIESKSDKWPMTRCEFRFKALSRQKNRTWEELISACLFKTKLFLETIPNYISTLDEVQVKNLLMHFNKSETKSVDNQSKNITLIIMQYAPFIYSKVILEAFYHKLCNGSFKDWFYRFKRSGIVFELLNKSDMKSYIKRMISSINTFDNSLCARSQLEFK